jgi:hypothetical protein
VAEAEAEIEQRAADQALAMLKWAPPGLLLS